VKLYARPDNLSYRVIIVIIVVIIIIIIIIIITNDKISLLLAKL